MDSLLGLVPVYLNSDLSGVDKFYYLRSLLPLMLYLDLPFRLRTISKL